MKDLEKGVKILEDTKKIKGLLDPIRREIVRLLAEHAMSAKDLTKILGLSFPTVGHHLKILLNLKLIKLVKEEIGVRGTIKRIYRANAMAYVFNEQNVPLEIKRYLMPINLERARAILTTLSFLRSDVNTISTRELVTFSDIFHSALLKIAPNYYKTQYDDREELLSNFYQDALKHLQQNQNKLPKTIQNLFSTFSSIC